MENVAKRLFQWTGTGDTTSTSALAALCRRGNVDCELGIALHGLSLSGMLHEVAPRYATGVTAVLAWSAGVYAPGGNSCCGLFSGDTSCCTVYQLDGPASCCQPAVVGGDVSCCTNTTYTNEYPGGNPIMCAWDNSTSLFLARHRRRLIMAEKDSWFGDCICHDPNPNTLQVGDVWDRSLDLCTCDSSHQYGAQHQSKTASGYDCGSKTDCIQSDGSGYYIASQTQIGGFYSNRYQAHNFHVLSGEDTTVKSALATAFELNPNFVTSRDPWGMQPGFDWLATTALTPLAADTVSSLSQ